MIISTMKNLFTKSLMFLGVFGLLVLASCSDDDDDGDSAPASLVIGTWSYESATLDITVDGVDIIDFFTAIFEAAGLETEEAAANAEATAADTETGANIFAGSTFVFNADGTYNITFGDNTTSTGGWTESSDSSTVTLSPDPDDEDPNPMDVVLNVDSISETSATFSFSQTESGDLTGDGEDNELTINFTMTVTK